MSIRRDLPAAAAAVSLCFGLAVLRSDPGSSHRSQQGEGASHLSLGEKNPSFDRAMLRVSRAAGFGRVIERQEPAGSRNSISPTPAARAEHSAHNERILLGPPLDPDVDWIESDSSPTLKLGAFVDPEVLRVSHSDAATVERLGEPLEVDPSGIQVSGTKPVYIGEPADPEDENLGWSGSTTLDVSVHLGSFVPVDLE